MLANYPYLARRGFTFVELTITILIMGILAAAAAPRYVEATARFRVEAAAKRIAKDMNTTRDLAMTLGSTAQGINFYFAIDRYQMVNDPDLDRPSEEYWVDLSQTAYPVDLVSTTFINTDGSNNTIAVVWDYLGRAKAFVSPVTAKSLASGQVVIASGNAQRSVVISPVTGKASVQ